MKNETPGQLLSRIDERVAGLTESSNNYYKKNETDHSNLLSLVDKVHEQALRTNGRVTSLENREKERDLKVDNLRNWKTYLVGWAAGVIAVASVLATIYATIIK